MVLLGAQAPLVIPGIALEAGSFVVEGKHHFSQTEIDHGWLLQVPGLPQLGRK